MRTLEKGAQLFGSIIAGVQPQTSIANKSGQYYQLINEQHAKAQRKTVTDSIVGRGVQDYLRLRIDPKGSYYAPEIKKMVKNYIYGLVNWVDNFTVADVLSNWSKFKVYCKYPKKCIETRNKFLNNLRRNKKWLNLL